MIGAETGLEQVKGLVVQRRVSQGMTGTLIIWDCEEAIVPYSLGLECSKGICHKREGLYHIKLWAVVGEGRKTLRSKTKILNRTEDQAMESRSREEACPVSPLLCVPAQGLP